MLKYFSLPVTVLLRPQVIFSGVCRGARLPCALGTFSFLSQVLMHVLSQEQRPVWSCFFIQFGSGIVEIYCYAAKDCEFRSCELSVLCPKSGQV